MLMQDAAKLSWAQAIRYLIAAQRPKQRGLDDMVSDMVEVLDKMTTIGWPSSGIAESGIAG